MSHVLAIGGYSRKIVGFITLPKKNLILIYDLLFRPLLLSEGLWNQVRVDHGNGSYTHSYSTALPLNSQTKSISPAHSTITFKT